MLLLLVINKQRNQKRSFLASLHINCPGFDLDFHVAILEVEIANELVSVGPSFIPDSHPTQFCSSHYGHLTAPLFAICVTTASKSTVFCSIDISSISIISFL